jgi:hypothetical protein
LAFWLLLLLLAVFGPFLLWIGEPATPLNVLIVDKTVPTTAYREHRGLVWVLNHLKYRDSIVSGPFKASRDYVGFFPKGGLEFQTVPVPTTVRDLDLLYLADTYGVYDSDLLDNSQTGNRSELIYGGLGVPELESLEPIFDTDATVIAEFNTLASPTPMPVRERLEALLGLRWTGWTGRHFSSTDREAEVPVWLVENWERQIGREWTFREPGFALVHEDGRVVVLVEGRDVAHDGLRIEFLESLVDEIGITNSTPYAYWFDLVESQSDVTVLAEYEFALTESGRRTLRAHGLPERFPAVLVRGVGPSRRYYFAGDFADMRRVPRIYRVRGVSWLRRLGVQGEAGFFWNVYVPLMRWILVQQAAGSIE